MVSPKQTTCYSKLASLLLMKKDIVETAAFVICFKICKFFYYTIHCIVFKVRFLIIRNT